MQPHQAQQEKLAYLCVVTGGLAGGVCGNEAHQRASERNFVVADQPGGHLQAKHTQQREQRQRAQRVVPHTRIPRPSAFEVFEQPHRGGHKLQEPRPPATKEAPTQPEQNQRNHGIAKPHVPDHQVAAQAAGDEQAKHRQHQQPMKQTGGQIPNANFLHVKLQSIH